MGHGHCEELVEEKHRLYLSLLAYKSTPLQNGYGPSELLMGRMLQSTVATTRSQRMPKLSDAKSLREKDEYLKNGQKVSFDANHSAKELLPLTPGESVWVPDREMEGRVGDEVASHLYKVTTADGTYRRN